MTRNLKALGLALLAAFAMSAVAASAASAQDVFTTNAVNGAYLTGTQVGEVGNGDNEFNTKWKNAPVTCTHAVYTSTETVANGAKEIKVSPKYEGCKALGQNATVDTTGCDFILTGTTDLHEKTPEIGGTETDATVSLSCTAGNSIKITVPSVGCTITMAPANNQNLLGVVYTNEGVSPTEDVKVDVTVDKIHYTSSFACQLGGLTATDKDAYLTQTVTVKGYSDAAHTKQVNVTVS